MVSFGAIRAGRTLGMLRWATTCAGVASAMLLGAAGPCSPEAPATAANAPVAAEAPPDAHAVAARGRIEPKNGTRTIAGPSDPVVVVSRLLVDKGDRVTAGQVIALLDDLLLREADAESARARVTNADAELRRALVLHHDAVISDSRREKLELDLKVARAESKSAEVRLERARVRSPIDGQVIQVYARDGERVGPEGIVELGITDAMYAIAEVYETDIGKIRLGQRATVTSPVLPDPLEGTVDRIGRKVGKLDALGVDPAARTDARVVEVEIRLDRSEPAATLTNLQVEIVIHP